MPVTERSEERGEADAQASARRSRPTQRLGERFSFEAYALLLAWVALAAVFWILRPETFGTPANARTILGSQSVLVILALGLTLVLIVGEFDLSIGATLGFGAMLTAYLNVHAGWPLWAAVIAALVCGALIGAINGVLVVSVGVDALVATLGLGTLVTGVTFATTNYLIVSGVDRTLIRVFSARPLGLPLSFFYALLIAAGIWYFLRLTPTGRRMVFVGGSREAARLSGVPVAKLRFGAFIACGVLAAFAGVALTGTLGSADPGNGLNFLLPAFAAAFLGSTTIQPGHFNPWGTVAAVYFLVTGITGLQLLGLAQWIQEIFYGGSLIVAIVLAKLVAKRHTT